MTEMTPREKRIHTAIRELIDEAGGCDGAAEVLGLKKSQIGRMRVYPPEAMMSAFQKSKLEAFVGKPIVTKVEAEMLGFEMVAQDAPTALDGCPNASHAAVLAEACDLAKTYAQLSPDGLSVNDSNIIDAILKDLARATERARQAFAAIRPATTPRKA